MSREKWEDLLGEARDIRMPLNANDRDAILYASRRIEVLEELIGDIAEKAENYLCAAKLPVPPSIHVEGLRGGMEEIKKMADAALRDPPKEEG